MNFNENGKEGISSAYQALFIAEKTMTQTKDNLKSFVVILHAQVMPNVFDAQLGWLLPKQLKNRVGRSEIESVRDVGSIIGHEPFNRALICDSSLQ